jgi:superfamily II DNA or RNA helicase
MVVQSIGRIVRPHKDKKMAYVYDLVDDASYEYIGRSGYPVVKTNYMVKHYDIRRSYYDEDEIPVEEINFTGIYEAKIDESVIAERKKKAADKAKAKAEKAASKSKAKVFKNKFFL